MRPAWPPEWPPRLVWCVRITSLSWSYTTESNRRPSPYHACRFRPAASPLGRVTARQADGLVWLRLPRPGGVVTWFVTGPRTDRSVSLTGTVCTHRAWLALAGCSPFRHNDTSVSLLRCQNQ